MPEKTASDAAPVNANGMILALMTKLLAGGNE
jgi:hypothetical protein